MKVVGKLYVAETNSDRTEGRGIQYVLAASKSKTALQRHTKNKYIQGSDCPIGSCEILEIDGQKYVMLENVPMVIPTAEDLLADHQLELEIQLQEKKLQVLEKAKTLGLSDEEIKILKEV